MARLSVESRYWEWEARRTVCSLVPSHTLDLSVKVLRLASALSLPCHLRESAFRESLVLDHCRVQRPFVVPSPTAQDIIEWLPHIQVSKGFGSLTSHQVRVWRFDVPGGAGEAGDGTRSGLALANRLRDDIPIFPRPGVWFARGLLGECGPLGPELAEPSGSRGH
jgi:hypothetical protein